MDDWQLLKNYATNHSEEAFRALVSRYSGMVYHAALRQTGNPHAAEEIAQIVFIALAQKAGRVPRQATLYGWLFRATRFAVLNQVRKNANRERHEQEALVMQPTIEASETHSTWERLTPQLNDALESLSAADRELVMIRFFGNKSHKEAAEAVGVSEETARKRLSRAMERLREIFARRGVVISSLALASAFAAHGAQAAPMEAASSWADLAMSKAALGTAATSAGKIFVYVHSAKLAVLLAVLVLVGASFVVFQSIPHKSPDHQAMNIGMSQDAHDTSGSLKAKTPPSTPAAEATVSATALDKVKAALHDQNPTTNYPNSVMEEAITGLGDNKKVAIPIMEEGLKDGEAVVRLRAVDGLGIVGPLAGPSAPQVLKTLSDGGFNMELRGVSYAETSVIPRVSMSHGSLVTNTSWSDPVYPDNIILYSLAKIQPSPEQLTALAHLLRENKTACASVYRAIHQFGGPYPRSSLQYGGWLWEMAGESSKTLNDAFRPLLQDPQPLVRQTAASALVQSLGSQADQGVFAVAIEMIKSSEASVSSGESPSSLPIIAQPAVVVTHAPNSSADIRAGLALLTVAACEPGQPDPNGPRPSHTLYAPRLGSYLNEVVSALSDVAQNSKDDNLKLKASAMLEVLLPEFQKSYPAQSAKLEEQSQGTAFFDRVVAGEATIPEIIDGMKKYPMEVRDVARYFSFNGSSNDAALVPAFEAELAARLPSPEANIADRARALNMRRLLADALHRIAPERAKVIFTVNDTDAIARIWRSDQELHGDAERWQKVSAALASVGWANSGGPLLFEANPDSVRKLLAALKQVDGPLYATVLAQVKEIDPHFSDLAIGVGKEN